MLDARGALSLSFLALFACKGAEDRAHEGSAAEPPAEVARRPAEPAPPPPAPAPAPAAAEPARPEPSTPEEVETALKAAMVAGHDLDVIKYCEQAGVEAGKGNPQTLLGCSLAACRAGQADKAKAWSKSLPKPLKKQAVQICLASQVTL